MDEGEVLADFLNGDRRFEHGLYGNSDFYDIFYSRDADFDKPLELVEGKVGSGSKILYLGCGTGLMLERLEEKYEVVGVDASPEMVEKARERCSSEIICSDFSEMDFEGDFDAAISFGQGLNYLKKGDLKEALKSAKELLKSSGVLIFDSFSQEYLEHRDIREHKIKGFTVQLNEKVKENSGEWCELSLRYKVTDDSDFSVELSDKHQVRLYGEKELRKILLEMEYENVGVDKFYESDEFLHVIATVS